MNLIINDIYQRHDCFLRKNVEKYTLLSLLGSSIGLVLDETEKAELKQGTIDLLNVCKQSIIDHIRFTDAQTVYLIHHFDCPIAKEIQKKMSLQELHKDLLEKASKFLQAEFPNVNVICIYKNEENQYLQLKEREFENIRNSSPWITVALAGLLLL